MPKNTATVFSVNSDRMRHNFGQQRKRLAAKLKNSRINQITFHTFRHWKATMEYRKTRDILHVKEVLGHKSLNSTMLYTQLISFKDDDFTATRCSLRRGSLQAGGSRIRVRMRLQRKQNLQEAQIMTYYKKIFNRPGISGGDVEVDRGGFEPPTS